MLSFHCSALGPQCSKTLFSSQKEKDREGGRKLIFANYIV